MEYRRLNTDDSWHWCTHCPHWPTGNYDSTRGKPDGNFCDDCHKLEVANQCEPLAEPKPGPL
jgi:hypothetical protein